MTITFIYSRCIFYIVCDAFITNVERKPFIDVLVKISLTECLCTSSDC